MIPAIHHEICQIEWNANTVESHYNANGYTAVSVLLRLPMDPVFVRFGLITKSASIFI